MTKRGGIITVDHHILADALHLPNNATIVAVEQDMEDRLYGRFKVLVLSPDLPEVAEGAAFPEVTPTVEYVFSWNTWGVKDNT